MSEIFKAIGFEITDEESYDTLAVQAEDSGECSVLYRTDLTLHGRCWRLSDGLEVWSVLCERENDLFYADCRPAFRSRYARTIRSWELIEYEEDGEAVVKGKTSSGVEVVFELQNLTEIDPHLFREQELQIALAGLAYDVHGEPVRQSRIGASNEKAVSSFFFKRAVQTSADIDAPCDNDYDIRGRIIAMKELKNAATGAKVLWLFVDAGSIRLEVIANATDVTGALKLGSIAEASVWLQGHVLEAHEVTARFEGVDPEHPRSDYWLLLRRGN
ncbi:MAG: hypothetical protein DMF61_08870 [Blastocatellia bacterium AA13]|nr:MAG: hypothetical protein DMF61_08870 [Blastocatellia bacterium AA13]